jgi:hypothetical protein
VLSDFSRELRAFFFFLAKLPTSLHHDLDPEPLNENGFGARKVRQRLVAKRCEARPKNWLPGNRFAKWCSDRRTRRPVPSVPSQGDSA